jgi:hypothetical protein
VNGTHHNVFRTLCQLVLSQNGDFPLFLSLEAIVVLDARLPIGPNGELQLPRPSQGDGL